MIQTRPSREIARIPPLNGSSAPTPVPGDLLLETGDFLLLESGDKLILE